jgi:hypothetical protein
VIVMVGLKGNNNLWFGIIILALVFLAFNFGSLPFGSIVGLQGELVNGSIGGVTVTNPIDVINVEGRPDGLSFDYFFEYAELNDTGVAGEVFQQDFVYNFSGLKPFYDAQDASSYSLGDQTTSQCISNEFYFVVDGQKLSNSSFEDSKNNVKGIFVGSSWLGGNLFTAQGVNETKIGGGDLVVRGILPSDSDSVLVELWVDSDVGTNAGIGTCTKSGFIDSSTKILGWVVDVEGDLVEPIVVDPVVDPVLDVNDFNFILGLVLVFVLIVGGFVGFKFIKKK